MVFVGKNKVILGSDVRLVRVFQGIWILFSLRNGFVRKNKVILGSDVNGGIWSHMEPNGAKWSHMQLNGVKWSQMELYGGKWS